MEHSYTIPSFPRYKITRKGIIIDTESGKARAASKSDKNTFYLYNTDGKLKRVGLKKVYREVFGVEYSVDNTENLPGEVWKPIQWTDGRYQASNWGRIKSLVYYEAVILKPFDNGTGYLKVDIQGKKLYIHRIIALVFLGEPEPGKDTIHHRNHNRQDNRLENLEYLSLADNIREAKARKAA